MQKLIYLSFLMLLCSATVHAQEDKPLYLYQTSAQFQEVDFTGFNQELESLFLLTLPNNTMEIGAGATRIYRRFTTGMTLVFGFSENELADISGQSSRFRYGGIHLSQAFNILNPESSWFLGPEVAMNLTFQKILITGRNNGRNFIEAANNAVYDFERFSQTLDASLRLHKTIQYNDGFQQARTVLIGLNGGYRAEGVEGDEFWRLNKAIRQDLDIVTGGWFGAVTFGVTLY